MISMTLAMVFIFVMAISGMVAARAPETLVAVRERFPQ